MKPKNIELNQDRQRQIIELFEHICRCDFKILMANLNRPWVYGEDYPFLPIAHFSVLIDELRSFAGGELIKAEKDEFLQYALGLRPELEVQVMSVCRGSLPGSYVTIKIHQTTN